MTPNDSVEALLDRGDNQLDRGQYQDGLDTFQQAALLEPENPKVLYGLGLACYRLKRYQESIEYLTQALTKKPLYPLVLARRGMAYQALKQNQQATADFDRAISMEAQDPEDWRGRGLAFDILKRYEEAIACYDKAIELQPDEQYTWVNRGLAFLQLERYEEAIASYDKAIKLQPDAQYTWVNRGFALAELKRYEEAIASYEKAIELQPDLHYAWNNRGNALSKLKRYEEAIASYDKAIKLQPDFHDAWITRGHALTQLKRYEEAIACSDKAIELQPDDHIAWNNRGYALKELKRYEEAIADLTKAINIKPDYWLAWVNRGWAIFDSRELREALENWYNGLRHLQPTDRKGRGELHDSIGQAYYRHGKSARGDFKDFLEAKESYERAREDFNTEPLLQRNLNVLESLIQVSKELPNSEEVIKELRSEGTLLLEQLFKQPHMTNAQKISLSRQFASFDQYVVDELVHSGKTIEALEFAEQRKNQCLVWLQRGWSDPADSPKYSQIKQLLKPHTAAIYWHLSPVSLTTFILRYNDKEPKPLHQERTLYGMFFQTRRTSSRPAVQQREFEQWMQEWKGDYQNYRATETANKTQHPWRQKMRAQLDKLRGILDINKILPDLEGIKQLILIPHRDLHLLPLEALFSENFKMTRLPSCQLGLMGQNPQLPDSVLNLENSRIDLDFALIQAKAISILSPQCQPLEISGITQEQLVDILPGNTDGLHFSGHGRHDLENPQNSALLLAANHWLTLADILEKLDLKNYRLVFLSACETGIVSQENLTDEYVGLVSGFLKKGANHVVSTLWRVDERSTAVLTIQFYQLLKDGKTPDIALKEAKQWLRQLTYRDLANWYNSLAEAMNQRDRHLSEKLKSLASQQCDRIDERPFNHPYHWAAFTLTGRPPN